jgi:FAD/FMN-containing dehydrogenase
VDVTDELLYYLRQAASLINGFPKMHARECIPPQKLIEAADEIERLRKIMTDFAAAEREYQDASEDLDIVYFKEEWKKAWKAFTEEVEKYD